MRTLLVAALLALTSSACGGGGGGGGAPPGARPSSTAVLAIVDPANAAIVPAGSLTVRLDLQGARIVDVATTVVRPDEGHVHLSLDGKLVSMAYGLEQQVEVTPGIHQLVAELVARDHAQPQTVTRARRTYRWAEPGSSYRSRTHTVAAPARRRGDLRPRGIPVGTERRSSGCARE